MQLPPMLRRMSLCELTSTYKGDISAALKQSRDEKVMPQMTPLVRKSVRRAAAVSRLQTSGIQTIGASSTGASALVPAGSKRRTVLSGKSSVHSSAASESMVVPSDLHVGSSITSIQTSGGNMMQVDDVNASRLELAKIDILSSTMLHQFMSQSTSASATDFDKVAALAALKKQIAIIEKAMPSTAVASTRH